MNRDNEQLLVSQFQSIIEILNPCMDDFLYIYDIKNDFYCISPDATKRFCIEKRQFHSVWENLKKFVYPADLELLNADIRDVVLGNKVFHNLQYRWMGRDGKPVWINCRGQVTQDEDGRPEFLIGCINEIGRIQKADNTSGLLGEASLQQEVEMRSERRISGFLMRVGIDNFRDINENHGMDYGDMILRKTAECIQETMETGQRLYRIIADEFVVADFSGRTVEDAKALYNRIRMQIDSFIGDNGYEVFYTVSAGILCLDDMKEQKYADMVRYMEYALAEAKNKGKNQCYVYSDEDFERFLRKRKLIRTMRHAVNRNFEGFETFFQPIMDIQSNTLSSAETLLRFSTEETGFVSPAEFIPLLEESGLIIPVGRWVMYKAMEACGHIQKKIPNFHVSVNVSYVQILKSDVLADIRQGMREYELKPGSIIVELTESGYLETDAFFIRFCDGLKDSGALLALDDFGTGYSNFQYLYNLSPDTIKIDRSFTLKALGNKAEYNLLHYMVQMAHCIQIKLCIEGIETEDELEYISQMQPDYIQGYYFGKPCPYEVFVAEHIDKKALT